MDKNVLIILCVYLTQADHFILQKDFFVKNDANEQETGPKKQKQKSSKRNQETEASCKENKKI